MLLYSVPLMIESLKQLSAGSVRSGEIVDIYFPKATVLQVPSKSSERLHDAELPSSSGIS